jgi:adenylate cyclase
MSAGPIADVPVPKTASLRLGVAATFLLERAGGFTDVRGLLEGLARALEGDSVVVDRQYAVLTTMHPLVAAVTGTWRRGAASVEVRPEPWGGANTDAFRSSPIARFFDGSHVVIRRHLCEATCPDDFAIVSDLRAQGLTDYLAFALSNHFGSRINVFSCATREPGGFSADQLHTLLSLQPLMALVVEAHVDQRIATTLLRTYLGDDAGDRVLAGQVQRGQGEAIPAVVAFCDLRDFTGLSDRLPRQAVLSLLDDTFDAVVAAVAAHGGEVLKFIGDAVLAVFRARPGEEAAACALARDAVVELFGRVADKNASRGTAERPTIELSVSLHVGEVHYGNIGGPSRLDFTVVGPAVNLASRLQGLCGPLGHRVVVSEAFAGFLSTSCTNLGEHRLKGLHQPVRAFALKVT